MKKITLPFLPIALFAIISFIHITAFSQNESLKLYHPEADAKAEIASAVEQAKAEGKHVFLQIGGNWCVWCIRFHKFCKDDSVLNSYLNNNYIVQKVNYSNENKNEEILADFGYPQRFGFPVFVILDGEGNRIHTQDTGLLESGKGYDKRKILTFFKNWSSTALKPDSYR